jgi:hypothetical protein
MLLGLHFNFPSPPRLAFPFLPPPRLLTPQLGPVRPRGSRRLTGEAEGLVPRGQLGQDGGRDLEMQGSRESAPADFGLGGISSSGRLCARASSAGDPVPGRTLDLVDSCERLWLFLTLRHLHLSTILPPLILPPFEILDPILRSRPRGLGIASL